MATIPPTNRGETNVSIEMGFVLSIIPSITGTISALCSAFLIWSIVKGKYRSRESILVGLGFLNLLFSIACACSTWTSPADYAPFTPYVTKGSIATCNLQGFLYQAGTCSPLYNSCLCIFYILFVSCRRTDEELRKCVVPTMHGAVLGFAFGSAILALVLQLYNDGGVLGCYIANNQEKWCARGHTLSSCGRGNHQETLVWVLGAAPVLLSLLLSVISMIFLHRVVKLQENAYRQSEAANTPHHDDDQSIDSMEDSTTGEGRVENLEGSLADSDHPPERKPISLQRSKQIKSTALLYVIAFWTTYTPFLVIGILSAMDIEKPVWLRVVHVFCLPSQGLFNLLIYRKRYLQQLYRRMTRRESHAAHVSGTAMQNLAMRAPRAEAVGLDRLTYGDESVPSRSCTRFASEASAVKQTLKLSLHDLSSMEEDAEDTRSLYLESTHDSTGELFVESTQLESSTSKS